MDLEQGVIRHYTRGDLNEIVVSWLSAAGRDPHRPSPDDLAPIDELHSGGREATVAFAEGLLCKGIIAFSISAAALVGLPAFSQLEPAAALRALI